MKTLMQIKMFKIKTICTILAIPVIAVLLNGNVYAAGKGATPNGKPFVELNGYIHEIEGEVSTIQDQIESLVDRVDTIEDRVAANESAITDLQATNVTLQAQIDANATDIASIEAGIAALNTANADLQAQIDDLGDADGSLQAQIDANLVSITAFTLSLDTLEGSLQAQINNNLTLIAVLQSEVNQLNANIQLKQDLVDGTCPNNYAIQQILGDGSVICEAVGGTSGQLHSVYSYIYQSVGRYQYGSLYAYCPSGYTATGAGYSVPNNVTIFGNYTGSNSLYANYGYVFGRNNNNYSVNLYSVTTCTSIVP